MKILLTGGAGYVGSSLAQRLIEIGHHVIVWDNLTYGGEGILPLIGHPRFWFEKVDLSQSLPPCDCDAVVHLAAIVGEPACLEAGRATATAINVRATKRVVGHFLDKPLVFFSTCSNYGRRETECTEDTRLRPTGIYSENKIEAEKYVKVKGKVVLRFATICGPSPRPRFDLLVNDMARRAVEYQPIQIFSPDAWRPFIHIHDVADAVLLGLAFTYPGVYNVVGENTTKRDLALQAKNLLGLQVDFTESDDIDPRDYKVSGKRFEEHTGFVPKYGTPTALLQVAEQVKVLPETGRRVYRNVA